MINVAHQIVVSKNKLSTKFPTCFICFRAQKLEEKKDEGKYKLHFSLALLTYQIVQTCKPGYTTKTILLGKFVCRERSGRHVESW